MGAVTNKNNKDDNKKWLNRILIIGLSGLGKINALLNLIQKQDNKSIVDKICFYAKDLSELKYQFLIKKREDAGIKKLDDPSAFIEYSNTMDDVYSNIDDYNSKRKRNILIVFDDMIADIMTNKHFQAIIKELFIRCRKLNESLAFIIQSYFRVPKDVRMNSTYYLIMKTHNRRELPQIAIDYSEDIGYKDFMKIHKSYINEPYSFLTIDTIVHADNRMRFRKKFSDFL